MLQLSVARAIMELALSVGVITYQVTENDSECHEISVNVEGRISCNMRRVRKVEIHHV